MESGSSPNVLDDCASFLPFATIEFRFVVGLKDPDSSFADSVGVGSGAGLAFPDIMLAHNASTSTVAAVVSAKGFFFSSFLFQLLA